MITTLEEVEKMSLEWMAECEKTVEYNADILDDAGIAIWPLVVSSLKIAIIRAETAEAKLAEAVKALEMVGKAKQCPNCNNEGFWVSENRFTGESEQNQCQFCYTEEFSLFNVVNRVNEFIAKLKDTKNEND